MSVIMKTLDISPEEMAHNIVRFDELVANKAKTGNKIPPEARERMTARATKTVIADPTAAFPPPRNGKSTSGKVTNVPLPISKVVTYCDQEIKNVNKLATRRPDDMAGKVT